MSKLTSLEKVALVKQLIKHKRDMDVFREKFDELFGVQNGFPGSSDGHYQVFSRIFNDYIKMVANEIGESQEGIEWFVWENDCGKKGLHAWAGDRKPNNVDIRTAEDYVAFLMMQDAENSKSEDGAEILSK